MRRLLVLAVMIGLAAIPAKAASLGVVLAVDVSASVTPDSYVLQHDGIARAFEDPRLLQAIAAAPGGIEVLVLEWSDPDKIEVTVDWTADYRQAQRRALSLRQCARPGAVRAA